MLKFKDVHKASKGLLGKTKVVTLLCVFSLLISSNESDACSVFAHKLKDNSLVVAKNFDWISGDGYLVVNARQMQRRSFREPELFKWVSKYGSISFTTVGPGLPVSSMNEKGLVVEALVDKDFSGDFSHVNSLLSLEWAQYVLDNFESTDSVIEFSKKHAFDQVVVALHFFVCDRLGHCAVIESNDSDQSKLDIISDDDLLFKVLANGDWHKDYNKSQSLQGMLSAYISKLKFMPSFSSYKRFGTLVSTLKVGKQLSLSDVFDSLDQAKIVSLIRWQIAWKPNEKVVHWRRYNGYGAGKIQRYSTAELSYACDKKIQVMDLHDFSTNHLRDYKMSDINKVEERLRKVMYWRLGGVEKSLAANLARFTMSSKCVR
ncbi:MAG: linear amide C-N hydrolase [Bdellovibrionota bacterium]